jgi:predicted RNA binding protein YcfA (HicA-like mRNA interferase family)
MSKSEKLLAKFLETPTRRDLTFQDLKIIMSKFGFVMEERTGSRVAFTKEGEQPIMLHKPHPGNELKQYIVKQLQERLRGFMEQ